MFIDTHTHLYDESFSTDGDQAVERAVSAGVTKMILPDIDSSTRDAMFSLADRHPGILYPCIGLHPTSIGEGWEKELDEVLSLAERREILAIGEIGLDCYWSKDFLKQQQEAFREQLILASRLSLPVIIHSRESTGLIMDILKECRNLSLKGVMHAYSGSAETFRELQELGEWYIGIGGVLTYKKASIAETVKQIPLERILLETDSPYLTPAPHRGKRNESSYIPFIAEKLAAIKETSLEHVAAITTDNARKLFGI